MSANSICLFCIRSNVVITNEMTFVVCLSRSLCRTQWNSQNHLDNRKGFEYRVRQGAGPGNIIVRELLSEEQ